jgi:hypothetical protein
VTCRICGDSFAKKNERMLSHLEYIYSNGERNTRVKLCKNLSWMWLMHSKDVAVWPQL